jgi:hypothetical protein
MIVNGYKIEPGADLRGADLQYANLLDANLLDANLQDANLQDANLQDANLLDANLQDANLRRANLLDANLRRANLQDANLQDANLQGANLLDANLQDANLRRARNIPPLVYAQTLITPEGDIIGYKKCLEGVVKLKIPADALRHNAAGRKCRAEWAIVLETPNHEPAYSLWDNKFCYTEAEIVKPNGWDNDRWNECSHGIHFYLTREEAEAH